MNRKGPLKYPQEMIQSAIARMEGGAKLSSLARELGVAKTTLQYWLDHANRYVAEEKNDTSVASRIKGRMSREVWDIIFSSLRILKGKLSEASPRDLVQIVSELFDRQAQFGVLNGRNRVPDKVIEVSEEVKITVQRFLEKQETPSKKMDGDVIDVSPTETGLSAATPDQASDGAAASTEKTKHEPKAKENGANG